MKRIIKCSSCSEMKEYFAKGMCRYCYNKQYRKTHKIKDVRNRKQYMKQWYKNHPNYDRERLNQKPMLENKSCTLYLGIHAEIALSKIFKNVTRMTNGNKGYDFICNRDMKIDVKAACRRNDNKKSDRWIFNIRKNIIADYFLCIAFNNKDDIKPEYCWLINGSLINNKTGLSINESQIHKWDKYKLDIDEVKLYYDKLRGDNK